VLVREDPQVPWVCRPANSALSGTHLYTSFWDIVGFRPSACSVARAPVAEGRAVGFRATRLAAGH